MKFRYDIGILRAIAVLSVVLFHFRVPFFEGGFVGVDVFFVISGFLMTKIILSGFDKKAFKLLEFYNKRVKRIIPPLLVAAIFILLFSTFFFFNSDLKQNSKNVFVSIIFISNIFYWLFSGYFDPESQNNIFLHSWSLSVEWQFYMIYPVLLLLVRKIYLKNLKLFTTLLLAFTAISFLLCIVIITQDANFAFYMIPTRAWEMTLGGLAFLYGFKVKEKSNPKIANLLVIFSYVLILVCNFTMNEHILWPSFYALIPTIATFVILSCNIEYSFIRNKILQFFGDISYSLYLWHWPVFITFKYFGFLDWTSVILMMIISTVLAYLSYKLVESNKRIANPKFVLISIPILLIISGFLFKYPDNIITERYKVYSDDMTTIGNFTFDYAKKHRLKQYNSCNCFLTSNSEYSVYDQEKCFTIDPNKKNILLLGDSHSAQLSHSFRTRLPENTNLLEVSAGFTMPFHNPSGRKESVQLIDKFYNEFLPESNQQIDFAVISAHWMAHNRGNVTYSIEELKENILETINLLEQQGIAVYVIGQSEVYTLEFPRIVVINKLFNKSYAEFLDNDAQEMNTYLKSFIPTNKFIDTYSLKNTNKFDAKTNTPYMMDDNHYTIFGANQIVDLILKRIN